MDLWTAQECFDDRAAARVRSSRYRGVVAMKIRAVLLALSLLGSTGVADEPSSQIAVNPAFEKLKTLVGSWQGTMHEAMGADRSATVRFKMISDGSALASWLGEDTPGEMVTMIHPDGTDLVATHYCSTHNQPRMVLVPGGDANRLVFRFRDGSNIAPGDAHMVQVAFVFDGSPDHHVEEWTFFENGKDDAPSHFDFHRKR